MTRPTLAVREATPDDLPALLTMWEELREMGSRVERPGLTSGLTSDEQGMRDRLELMARDPDSRALVATVDDEVAGMTVLSATSYSPLFEQRVIHAHYLHVREGFRKRGVGKALLTEAVAFADEVGAEHVVTSVPPSLRDTQRFYARLGFGPVQVRRSVPVAILRRRLAAPTAATVGDHVVARRRTLRRLRAAVVRAD